MRGFRIVPHTADVSIQVWAADAQALFEEALAGMSHIMKEGFCSSAGPLNRSETLEIRSLDITTLLIDFLSAVLVRSSADEVIFCAVDFELLESRFLRARISGRGVDDGFDEDIKAVTYHEADVVQTDAGRWETKIVFDI